MANVKFEGIKDDLTAPKTPWIYYGGSYAGARAAHMKILYPDLVFGAIASSGVTHAALSNWQYMDIIRRAADPTCMRNIEQSIRIVDTILTTRVFARPLKGLFGLADLEHDVDFVSTIEVRFVALGGITDLHSISIESPRVLAIEKLEPCYWQYAL